MNSQQPRVHLVYLRPDGLLITKNHYTTWREIQDEYEDYMTSLGAWTEEELVSFLQHEYGDDDSKWGFTRQQIHSFMNSPELLLYAP